MLLHRRNAVIGNLTSIFIHKKICLFYSSSQDLCATVVHSAFALDKDTTLFFLPPNDQGALREVQYLVLNMLNGGDLVQFEKFSTHK